MLKLRHSARRIGLNYPTTNTAWCENFKFVYERPTVTQFVFEMQWIPFACRALGNDYQIEIRVAIL